MIGTINSILDQTYPFNPIPMTMPFNACEPVISEETAKNHFEYLKMYVNDLNKLMEENEGYKTWSIRKILTHYAEIPVDLEDEFIESAGGIFNHEALFAVLCKPEEKQITGKLADDLVSEFGSIEEFKKEMKELAMRQTGTGYTCLVLDENAELTIINTENQENPLMFGMKPIFMIDLWEHAYYLDVQIDREKYIDSVYSVIDWDKIGKLYEDYLKEI